MRVRINSLTFDTGELPVGFLGVEQEPPVIRDVGVQLRRNLQNATRYIYNGWYKLGMGWNRADRATGRGVGGYRDGTWDTRFRIAEHGILNESQVHASPSDHARKYVRFGSGFHCLFEGDYQSTRKNILGVSKWTPDTWSAIDGPLFNATSNGTGTTDGNTMTVSHTVQATQVNRIVVAFASSEESPDQADPDTVTYNALAMTKLTNAVNGDIGISMWYRVNPSTGTNDCVATWGNNQNRRLLTVMDFYFVNQSTPWGTAGTDSGGAAQASTFNLTTTAGDLCVDGSAHGTGESKTPGANQTLRFDEDAAGFNHSGSVERATGISTTMSWTWATSDNFATCGAPLLAAGLVTFSATNGNGVRGFDIEEHKGNLYVLASEGQGAELEFEWWNSPNGDVWTKGGGTNWPSDDLLTTTITRRNNFDDDEGRILDMGNTLMMALHDNRAAGTGQFIRIFYSTNEGTTWTAGAVIPSGSGPKAFVRWLDITGADSPVLVTAEHVYRVDVGGTTFDKLYALDGDSNTGRWAKEGDDGSLYIGLGTGFAIALDIADGLIIQRQVGPSGDGLVAARQGHVNDILVIPGDPFIYLSYGGHAANLQAGVYAIDYTQRIDPDSQKRFQAWHHMYLESDANIDIPSLGYSPADDATPRLFFHLENNSSDEMFHLEQPLVSGAASGVSIKRQANAFMEQAEEDFDDPHGQTTVLRVRAEADGLDTVATIKAGNGTNTNHIEIEYGLNGAAWNNVSNFAFLGSDDLQAEFGRLNQNINGVEESGDPEGVAALTLRLRITGQRDGTETNGPQLKEAELQGINQVNDLLRFIVPIDLETTAHLTDEEQRNSEQVLDEVIAIIRSGILVPFEVGGRDRIFVKCRMLQIAELESREISLQYDTEELHGKTILVCEEALR